MEITLYVNTSEPNEVNKNLTSVGTFDGSFRGEASVTDPVFLIESDLLNFPTLNYAYVPYLGRKYFINGIVSVRTNLWQVSCHVDVLSTYWDKVKMLYGIVARQENDYNLYLDDDRFIVTAQRIYNTIAFPGRVATGSGDNNASFILTLAGGVGDEATETVVESS